MQDSAHAAVERMLGGSSKVQETTTDFGEEQPMKRPEPGSEEEKALLEAAWADPEFRNRFYAEHGDKLKAMGMDLDGTFPGSFMTGGIGDTDKPKGVSIIPEPGFVIKTKTLETKEKVFINFCKSPKVRSFGREPDPNDPTIERVRIPLSLGPSRNDLDKSGEPCIVYDVVFNTEVMDQALHAAEFKEFLVGLGMGWIMEKGGGGLDVKNWTYSKLRGNYKGKFPAMQVVRAEALIEEVPPDEGGVYGSEPTHHDWEHAALNPHKMSATRAAAENANYADSFQASQLHKTAAPPKYKSTTDVNVGVETPETKTYVELVSGQQYAYVEGKEYGGEVRALLVRVEMQRIEHAHEVDVDITERELALDVPGKYELEMELPLEVDDNAADAVFDRQKRVMTLTLPLKSWTAKAYEQVRAKHQKQTPTSADEGDEEGERNKENTTNTNPATLTKQMSEKPAAPQDKSNDHKQAKDTASKKTPTEFEAKLKQKLAKQSAKSKEERPKDLPVPGSKQDQEMKERLKAGATASDRRPFECERCQWRSAATAIRRCRRCNWCEQGSKEEAEMIEQVKEQTKWQKSRKADEVGTVDETGGIEDEDSVRAFRFKSRMAWELDDDVPSWLQGIREKQYGGEEKEITPGVPELPEGVAGEEQAEVSGQ